MSKLESSKPEVSKTAGLFSRPPISPGHALHVTALRLWRRFPWPAGRGRYFAKRLLLRGKRGRGPQPIPTRAGWLWLEWGEDVLQSTLYANGEHYEGEVTTFLQDLQLEGRSVLDIGAHAGFYALWLARAVGPGGRLIAFEPQEKLAAATSRSLEAAGASWARVERRAAGDRDGVLTLHQSKDGGRTTAGSLPEDEVELETLQVPMVRLDRFISERFDAPPALIKIDIEGAEWLALEGLGDLLAGPAAPTLVIEMHPRQINDLGGSPAAIVERLADSGYRLRRLHHREGLQPLEPPYPNASTWHLVADKAEPT